MWVNSRCAIAAWLECLQEKSRMVLEWTGLPGEESVKRFERSNGLDTALYKTIPFVFMCNQAGQLQLVIPSRWNSWCAFCSQRNWMSNGVTSVNDNLGYPSPIWVSKSRNFPSLVLLSRWFRTCSWMAIIIIWWLIIIYDQAFHWGWLLAFEHCVVHARTQKHTDRQSGLLYFPCTFLLRTPLFSGYLFSGHLSFTDTFHFRTSVFSGDLPFTATFCPDTFIFQTPSFYGYLFSILQSDFEGCRKRGVPLSYEQYMGQM